MVIFQSFFLRSLSHAAVNKVIQSLPGHECEPSLPSSLPAINLVTLRKTLTIQGNGVCIGKNRELGSISKDTSGYKSSVSYFRECLAPADTEIRVEGKGKITEYCPNIKTEARKTVQRCM